MARVVERPPKRRRKTEYPYSDWTCAKWMELRQGEDFHKGAESVANAYNAYCRRQGFAGKAVARRDESRGDLLHLVYVWGDRSRPSALGLPPEVLEVL